MGWLERLEKIAPLNTWALFGAGIVLTLLQICMVLLLWLGFDAATVHQRLNFIGTIAILQALDLMAVIASLSRARVAVRGPGGFSADVEGGVIAAPAVTTTTTTEIKK